MLMRLKSNGENHKEQKKPRKIVASESVTAEIDNQTLFPSFLEYHLNNRKQ